MDVYVLSVFVLSFTGVITRPKEFYEQPLRYIILALILNGNRTDSLIGVEMRRSRSCKLAE
jgi:hypothetical protein